MLFTNKLVDESSPYLLQHAHNPVQWYPWGEEALALAKAQDKPILVSIGYAACHWCHVMERESFESTAVAEFMNLHFINIKIDREERPDLDHIYMEAVQVMTGQGGWPLNVFLTPSLEPFYGGTYFPPEKAFNRPSWMDVLSGISAAWQNSREDICLQAGNLLEHLKKSAVPASETTKDGTEFFTAENAGLLVQNILKRADTVEGGFGRAPKFPQTFTLQNLLFAGVFFRNQPALTQAHLSLKKMIRGGIYDQIGGGLCRYSTDEYWTAPHFEKMLYDNALLLSTLSDAFRVSGDAEYATAIRQTFDFLFREMKGPGGGFYAALDADSEGEEGKYYVWEKEEFLSEAGDHAGIVAGYYGISTNGNWEGKNILTRKASTGEYAAEHGMKEADFSAVLVEANTRLLLSRNKRVRPATDDKILLGWNALLVKAFCDGYAALGEERYREEAISLYAFCKQHFTNGSLGMLHTWKNGVARIAANLEDYAAWIGAAIALQEVTGEPAYLEEATEWTEYVIEHFSSPGGFFYFTHQGEGSILYRKADIFDGATPSGNSLMVQHLWYLAVIWNRTEFRDRAIKNLASLGEQVLQYPTSFGVWANTFLHEFCGIAEIVITGKGFNNLLADVLKIYLPNKVLQSNIGGLKFPLLRGKSNSETMIHICKNYTCLPPMSRVADLETYVKNHMIK